MIEHDVWLVELDGAHRGLIGDAGDSSGKKWRQGEVRSYWMSRMSGRAPGTLSWMESSSVSARTELRRRRASGYLRARGSGLDIAKVSDWIDAERWGMNGRQPRPQRLADGRAPLDLLGRVGGPRSSARLHASSAPGRGWR
jgi:hypothetical protein